ncbi:MAG: nitrilase-related carbon-nitrogen hydrolase [Gammaproteobacteria bacterium]
MKTTVAVLQICCEESPSANIAKIGEMARRAAADGARIILPPELFERPYFCKTQRAEFYRFASTAAENPAVLAMQKLSAELRLVIPTSFYERAGNARFNSLALVCGGEIAGIYRKAHIPDGPGYQEKFYFSPGDTGFRALPTFCGKIGAAICWDQWFPEAARAMALDGADILLYPSAIGDEPHLTAANTGANTPADSFAHWQNAMRGHAAANIVSLAAANRIGEEEQKDAFGNIVQTRFYGGSFILDSRGEVVAQASRDSEETIAAELDFAEDAKARATWGIFRDRRPDLYRALISLDGGAT